MKTNQPRPSDEEVDKNKEHWRNVYKRMYKKQIIEDLLDTRVILESATKALKDTTQQTKLPTDEEIEKEAEYKFEYYNDNQDVIIGYKIGMKQMRDNYQPKQQPTNEEIEKQAEIVTLKTHKSKNIVTALQIKLGKYAWINGAKWVRDTYQPKPPDWNKILKGLQNYCLIDGDDKPMIGGKCIDYLKTELP